MEQDELKQALSKVGRGRGHRYPVGLRERVIAFASLKRTSRVSWEQIAKSIGLHTATVRAWCAKVEGARMRRVQVVDGNQRTVSVMSPSGYRIEGLTLMEATTLLAKLG